MANNTAVSTAADLAVAVGTLVQLCQKCREFDSVAGTKFCSACLRIERMYA